MQIALAFPVLAYHRKHCLRKGQGVVPVAGGRGDDS